MSLTPEWPSSQAGRKERMLPSRGPNRAAIRPFAGSMQGLAFQNDGGLLFMRRLILAGIWVLVGWPAHAEPVVLGDDTLKPAVSGKTVHLDTPFGVAVPITYHGNGLMSGKAGILEYFLGAEADRGRWWVADGKLCQKWFKWLDAQPSCMRLKQDGNRIYWRRDDGLTGTATIASALPPGADAAPRGLGGPVPTPSLGQSSVATEPPRHPRPATMSAAVPQGHHDFRASAVRAVGPIAPPSGQHGSSNTDTKANSAAQARLWFHTEPMAVGGKEDHWCHADLSANNAAPDLLIVTSLAYAGSELPSPTNACFAAEPPLQHLAKLGVHVH